MKFKSLSRFCLAACCCGGGAACSARPDAVVFYVASPALLEGGMIRVTYFPETQHPALLRIRPALKANYLAWSADGSVGVATLDQAVQLWFPNNDVPESSDPMVDPPLSEPVASGGDACCHVMVSPDGKFVYAANYSGGNFAEFRLQMEKLTDARVIVTPEGGKSGDARQEASHPHQCQFSPDGRFLAVVDLGLNAILSYPYDRENGVGAQPVAINRLHAGAGPRHLVFSADGKWAYVANELDSTISAMRYENGVFTESRHISVAAALNNGVRNYPAAIRLSPDGKRVLVSNRGDDTIAVISLREDASMEMPRFFDCHGKWPRDFAFSPDGRFLVVANEHSGNVCIFRWDDAAGALLSLEAEFTFPQVQSVLFVR